MNSKESCSLHQRRSSSTNPLKSLLRQETWWNWTGSGILKHTRCAVDKSIKFKMPLQKKKTHTHTHTLKKKGERKRKNFPSSWHWIRCHIHKKGRSQVAFFIIDNLMNIYTALIAVEMCEMELLPQFMDELQSLDSHGARPFKLTVVSVRPPQHLHCSSLCVGSSNSVCPFMHCTGESCCKYFWLFCCWNCHETWHLHCGQTVRAAGSHFPD